MASGIVQKQFTRQEILDMIYPVGAVYISTGNTSPATLFGGTWTKISGRFLLSTGNCSANSDNYFGTIKSTSWSAGLGSTGGEDYHTLSVSEMPSHTHNTQRQQWWNVDSVYVANTGSIYSWRGSVSGTSATYTESSSSPHMILNTGGGTRHNNMPPYFTVNMWYRTA